MVIANETYTSGDSRLKPTNERNCGVLSGSGFPHSAVNENASIKFSGEWLELKIFPRFIFQLFFSLTMGSVAKFLIGSSFLLAFHWRPH